MRRTLLFLLALFMVATVPAVANQHPDVIPLPNGFFPEGVTIGDGTTFYTGSLIDGAIYRGDVLTGEGDVWVEGTEGALAVGLDYDAKADRLYVAGGSGAVVTSYDAATGDVVDVVATPGAGFINDLIVTPTAVYATDSFAPVFWAIPLDQNRNVAGDAIAIPLSGDFEFEAGQFNANGIEAAAGGKALIIVNSYIGELYRVNPRSGVAVAIDLGGEIVNGDGLVLAGSTLYAVEGGKNQVTEIVLSNQATSGVVVGALTDPDFDVPTTADLLGPNLYVVSARFNTPPTPDVEYSVVRVDR